MNRRRLLSLAPALTLGVVAGLSAVRDASAAEERRTGGGESYVLIPTVTGTVIRGGMRRGVMSVQSGVDVPDAALRTRVGLMLPRLQAAFAQVVMTYAAGLPSGGVPNADYLSRELQRQTDMILGRPGARLLLGSIIING